jgi:hypothetical protein
VVTASQKRWQSASNEAAAPVPFQHDVATPLVGLICHQMNGVRALSVFNFFGGCGAQVDFAFASCED